MEEAKLLLVDDDPGTIQVLSRMLAGYGNQRFAISGADALRLAREAAPDLILLDAEMPGMSGFEVYKSLKADPLLAMVPVIFATSNLQAAMEAAALEAGAVDFVPKPLVAAQVVARVRAQLARRPQPSAPRAAGDVVARLLIVDADAAAAQSTRHVLAAIGECLVAAGADEALRLARSERPDVMLVDAELAGGDGFELCKRLKADAALGQVPLIVTARQVDARLEAQAFDVGAADFIARPVVPAVLRARVGNLLRAGHRAEADRPGPVEAGLPGPAMAPLLSCLANDIGKPLGGILDLAHSMARDAVQPLPPGQARRVEQIEALGRRLQELMRDVLDLNRFEEGRFKIDAQPVDVAACAERAVAVAAAAAAQVQVGLKLLRPAAGRIVGDAEQLQRCLVERLFDAIEHARPGGQVDVAVRSEGGEVNIEMNIEARDGGPGRREVHFSASPGRSDSGASAAAEGGGISLLLTRQRVGAMGGRLSVDGGPGRGNGSRLSFASA